MKAIRQTILIITLITMTTFFCGVWTAGADTGAEIDRDVDVFIEKLYAGSPAAAKLSKVAKGMLVFPNVVKAGMIVGGQYGQGALRIGGENCRVLQHGCRFVWASGRRTVLWICHVFYDG